MDPTPDPTLESRRRNALVVPAETVLEQAVFLARMALGDAPCDRLAHPFGLADPRHPMEWRLSPDYWDRLVVETTGHIEHSVPVASPEPRLLGIPIVVDPGLPPGTIQLRESGST